MSQTAQNQRRSYRFNHLDDVNTRRKVGNAAHALMSSSGQARGDMAYSQAEALVDSLIDLYGTIQGELPSFHQDQHSQDVARRLEHLEKAVHSYREAFESGFFADGTKDQAKQG